MERPWSDVEVGHHLVRLCGMRLCRLADPQLRRLHQAFLIDTQWVFSVDYGGAGRLSLPYGGVRHASAEEWQSFPDLFDHCSSTIIYGLIFITQTTLHHSILHHFISRQ